MLHKVNFKSFIEEYDEEGWEEKKYDYVDAFGITRNLKEAHILLTESMFKGMKWIKEYCDEKNIKEELKSNFTGIETLSIGVTMTIGEYAIVDKLADFLIQHPQINIHIHYGNTFQLLKLLDDGQISMAIVEGNYPKEKYTHKKYSTENYIAVCAASHNFITGSPHTINDLVCERLLVREEGSGTRNILEQSLIARGIHISDFIHYTEVENMHTIISLLKKDCGITFLYQIAVENELKSGILKEILLDDFKMQHDFDIIWEKNSIYADKYLSISEEFI